jgi:hypothetical protein
MSEMEHKEDAMKMTIKRAVWIGAGMFTPWFVLYLFIGSSTVTTVIFTVMFAMVYVIFTAIHRVDDKRLRREAYARAAAKEIKAAYVDAYEYTDNPAAFAASEDDITNMILTAKPDAA